MAGENSEERESEADDDVMACKYRPSARTPFKAATPEIPFRCRRLVRIAIILFL